MPAPDLLGREIAGRYRITKKLGEGGMGAVYRGEQLSLKRAVAVKVLRPELGSNQMILRRFNAEAEAVAKLSHPNTVNIYDFGQDTDGSLFIAMEYIEGRSLREVVQREAPLPPRRALAIALQVAASLSDAHAHSIVHRDLKPDNVMLQERGRQKDVVRVLDFGIAKLREDDRGTQVAMTQAGDMLGTPQYMAPEQIRGEAIDGRTDIYALGCMIYEMVTGRMPYEAQTVMAMLSKHLTDMAVPPTQRRPDLGLPPAIDELVAIAMAKSPAARPTSMDQFGEMIDRLLQTLPADPNTSGGMTAQQAAAAGAAITPMAYSALQPPTPPPAGGAQQPFGPPAMPPPVSAPAAPAGPPPVAPMGASPIAPVGASPIAPTLPASVDGATAGTAKSRAPLYAILGVLALGGAGVGVWALTREDPTPVASGASAHTPAPSASAKQDTWAGDSTPSLPPSMREALPANTALTPIPKGAYLVVPPGFVKSGENPTLSAYTHHSEQIVIALASLDAGTNDPDELAAMWSKSTGATLVQRYQASSAGASRDFLDFTADVQGTPTGQVIALYITEAYRLAVLYQAPLVKFSDATFTSGMKQFFLSNVQLP